MPSYVITDPEGKRHRVNAPEGATREQALAYFKQNWKPSAQRQPPQTPAQQFGSISAPPAFSVKRELARAGSKVADIFRAAVPGGEEPELGFGGKLAAAAVMPLAVPFDILSSAGETNRELAGIGAEKLAEQAPWMPPAIPATAGFVAGELADPLNWVGGPAAKAFAGEAPAVPGAAGRILAKADELIPKDFQYSPSNVLDQAQAVKKAGQMAVEGVKSVIPGRKAAPVAEAAAEAVPAASVEATPGLPTRQDFDQEIVDITGYKPGFTPEPQQELAKRSDAGMTEVDKLERKLERTGGMPEDLAGRPASIEAPVEQYPNPTPKATVKLPPQKPRWALVEGFEERGPAKVLEGKPGDSFTEVQFADGSKMRVADSGLTAAQPKATPQIPPQEPPRAPEAPVGPVVPTPPKPQAPVAGKRLNAPASKPLEQRGRADAEGPLASIDQMAWDTDPKAQQAYAAATPEQKAAFQTRMEAELRSLAKRAKKSRKAVEDAPGAEALDVAFAKATEPDAAEAAAVKARLEGQQAAAQPVPQAPATPKTYTATARIPAVEGAETTVRTPLGTHKARYRLVDLDAVKPSHDVGAGFRATEGYPIEMQPRDYAGNAAYQANVLDNAGAGKFDPAGQIFTDTSSAIEGPPVVLPDGSVIGGNGRTMTIKAAVQGDVGRQRQIDAVLAKAEIFGIPRAEVEKMVAQGKVPMVVREFSDAPTDMNALRALGAEFNKDIKKVADAAEDAYVKGTLISDDTMRGISSLAGDTDLNDWMKTQAGTQEIVSRLIKDKVITQNDLTLLMNPATKTLNEQGQRMVKDALAARLIGDLALYRNTPASFRDKLVSATGDLAHIESSEPSFRLGDRLREAVAHMVGQEARGIPRKEWLKQSGIPGLDDVSDDARTLVEAFLSPIKEFRQRMAIYAEAAPRMAEKVEGQESMFDLPVSTKYSPREAFDMAFRAKLDPKSGVTLGGDIIPGARQVANALEAVARSFAKTSKTVATTAEDALGLRFFGGKPEGMRWLIKWALPPSHVIPKWSFRERRINEAFIKTFEQFGRMADDALKTVANNPEAMTNVAKALDGKLPMESLTDAERTAAEGLRKWYDAVFEWSGLPKSMYRENYFTHVWTDPKKFDAWEIGMANDPRYTNPYFKARTGAEGYTFDLNRAVKTYAYRVTRDQYYNAFIKTVLDDLDTMKGTLGKSQKAYVEAWLERVAGKPGDLEKMLDNVLMTAADIGGIEMKGRPSAKLANAMAANLYRAFLGLRLRPVFRNFAQLSNTISEVGFRKVPAGLRYIYSPQARKAFRESGLESGEMLAEILLKADIINRPKYRRMVDDVIFYGMRKSEDVLRGFGYQAGLADGVQKGLQGKELEKYAKGISERANFVFGKGQVSPYMDNPLGKAVMVLKSYPLNQALLYYRRMQEGEVKKVLRMLMFDAAIGATSSYAGLSAADWLGYEPADRSLEVFGKIPFVGKGTAEWIANRQIPGVGRVGDIPLPTQAIRGALNLTNPTVQLGGKAASGETLKDTEYLSLAGVPVLAYKEYKKLAQEIYTGREVVKVRRQGPGGTVVFVEKAVGRPISVEEALAKYLKLLPERDKKKINQKEMSQKIYDAKAKFKAKATQ